MAQKRIIELPSGSIGSNDSIAVDSSAEGSRSVLYSVLAAALETTFNLAALRNLANGAMQKSTYDADADGVVDNAEALETHPASYFATAAGLSDLATVVGTKADVSSVAALAGRVTTLDGAVTTAQNTADAAQTTANTAKAEADLSYAAITSDSESSPASAAHAIGDRFYYNDGYYEAIAAIAAGDTLEVGTNIRKTTLEADIASLLVSLTNAINRIAALEECGFYVDSEGYVCQALDGETKD